MPKIAGSIQARFDKAYDEFCRLEGVDNDPVGRCHTVADLVYITQFEIDLVNEGQSEIDVTPHRKFVKKYS